MRIHLSSVFVDDQDKALRFYTDVLGFAKKTEVPLGEHRWLTLVSPEAPDGTELLLEPDGHPAVKPYKTALVDDGIPAASFAVDDVHAEFGRLRDSASASPRSPSRWDPSPLRCSTTRAATSSRSCTASRTSAGLRRVPTARDASSAPAHRRRASSGASGTCGIMGSCGPDLCSSTTETVPSARPRSFSPNAMCGPAARSRPGSSRIWSLSVSHRGGPSTNSCGPPRPARSTAAPKQSPSCC